MALVERCRRTTEATYWEGQIPVYYVYTAGRAGERFFREVMQKGRFLGTRCDRCGKTFLPPRIYCEYCFERLEGNYVEIPPTGTVHTFTISYRSRDGSPHPPKVIAFIQMDGTDGGVIHFLEGVSPQEVRIGMRVEAVFRPEEERKGGLEDILHFRPVEGG